MRIRRLLAATFGLCLMARAEEAGVTPFTAADRWKPGDAGAWEWIDGEGGAWLRLVRQSDFKPPVRSPFNLTWFEGGTWEGFELEVEARLTKFDDGNNDLCVAFAGRDDRHFYYAHLGEKADAVHHHIHLVNDADRTPVTTWRSAGTPWKRGTWHRIRLEHRPATGEIVVRFDGEPVLKAADKTLRGGRVGLGSFDDTGDFRRLVVRRLPPDADAPGALP